MKIPLRSKLYWIFPALLVAWFVFSAVTSVPTEPPTSEQLQVIEEANQEWAERAFAQRGLEGTEREQDQQECEYRLNGPWRRYAGVRDIHLNNVIVTPEEWGKLWFGTKEKYLKEIADCGHGRWGLDVIDGKTGKQIASWGPIFGLDAN